jgi:hypothetical protein
VCAPSGGGGGTSLRAAPPVFAALAPGTSQREMDLEALDIEGLIASAREIRSKARQTRSESRQAREEYRIAHLYHAAVMIEMRRARRRRALSKPSQGR